MPDQFRESQSLEPIEDLRQLVQQQRDAQIEGERRGQISLFTCPECSGTLWQVDQGEFVQFRCHVGHILSGRTLLEGQTEAVENALWFCIRTLTDKGLLARQMAAQARSQDRLEDAAELEAQALAAEGQAEILRRFAETGDISPA